MVSKAQKSLSSFAKVQEWKWHNPVTGYMEFKPGTPEHIKQLERDSLAAHGNLNAVIALALKMS